MNAGPRTGLWRQVAVPAPEQKQGVRAGRDDDVPSDGVARRAGGESQVRRSDHRNTCFPISAQLSLVIHSVR